MSKNLKHIILIFLSIFIYLIIDLGYQFIFGIKFLNNLMEKSIINVNSKNIALSNIFRKTPKILFIIMFIIIAGIANYMLSSRYAIQEKNYLTALFNGSILGLYAYGTLNLANYWAIQSWPGKFTIVDITFGTLCNALVSIIITAIGIKIN